MVSHAHLDHSGSLPRLSTSRNKQVIVGSEITRDVTIELLKDMIKVNEYNGTPLGYDNQTIDQLKGAWIPTDNLNLKDMNIKLYPAGHVAGAAIHTIAPQSYIRTPGRGAYAVCLPRPTPTPGSFTSGSPREYSRLSAGSVRLSHGW